ncbi:MAG: hypothetical protein WAL10_12515 [Acetobacteraceae bacterium]|jgi:hypothetical protein
MDGILTVISAKAAAEAWLRDFGAALASGEATRIAGLFADDCHWRDILAFTWDLRTSSGAASIAQRMACALSQTAPRAMALAPGRTPPRHVTRAGVDTIEAIFAFETSIGPCNGVVRLVSEGGGQRAWTLLTTLDEIADTRIRRTAGVGRTWTGSATSAGRTGSIGASGLGPTRTVTPQCSW